MQLEIHGQNVSHMFVQEAMRLSCMYLHFATHFGLHGDVQTAQLHTKLILGGVGNTWGYNLYIGTQSGSKLDINFDGGDC